MDKALKVGDLVCRKVDGKAMVIIGPSRFSRGEWECAWMDGHLRHRDEFTRHEIERYDPAVLDLVATEVADLQKLAAN